jgi:hypothetical protein
VSENAYDKEDSRYYKSSLISAYHKLRHDDDDDYWYDDDCDDDDRGVDLWEETSVMIMDTWFTIFMFWSLY